MAETYRASEIQASAGLSFSMSFAPDDGQCLMLNASSPESGKQDLRREKSCIRKQICL
ncbi:MAG: hypothetical protein RIR26_35 [Pseudomonadota bacterium]